MTTATRQGYQETKRDTRLRKRPLLKGEDAKYLESKYDTAFTLGAQSEDDYEVESVNGHKPRRTGKIVARAWWFQSEELRACKAAVDAVPDPKPPNKKIPTPSVRGPDRPGSPRPNKKLDNKIRRWMVDSKVLESHEKWITSGRVVEDDVTEGAEASKKRKVSSVLGAKSAAGPSDKGKQARSRLETREKVLKEELGDLTFEELLAD
ncbi:hypothetical protein FRC07_002230 [Ceratobasidium sp. 392]|nr:hypothetical protein FRC07_002230 [Ceratobasidium sp. 392]